jgi:uncharacterized protein (TIGR02145 family)
MKHIFTISLCFLALSLSAQGEPNGQCCDPDGTNYAGFPNCIANANPIYLYDDGCVEDPDCSNYNPNYGCVSCGEGTYWDFASQKCIITNPTDTNLDGCTDLNDLMDILANYGDCAVADFTCGDDIEHEGYNYSTVQIGDQCWFSENCRYLPEVSDLSIDSTTEPHYSVYGYTGTDVTAAQATSNYATYGVLYNWPAVMTEGVCPSGWHIPSDGEFTELTDFLGGYIVAGGKMKEAGYDHWNSPNTGATNSSGWTGLPGGYRYSDEFGAVGNLGYWWSASEYGSNSWSWARELYHYLDPVAHVAYFRYHGFSARCVRD